MNRCCFVAFAVAFIACQALADSLHAGELGRPQGKVILTVTGRIANRNDGDAATFDSAMLEALPRRSAVVRTPWTPGGTSFEGRSAQPCWTPSAQAAARSVSSRSMAIQQTFRSRTF